MRFISVHINIVYGIARQWIKGKLEKMSKAKRKAEKMQEM